MDNLRTIISVKKLNSYLSKLNKSFELPFEKKLSSVFSSFTRKEHNLFIFFVILLSVTTLAISWKVNRAFLVKVPATGGSFTEGVVGTPRFINPLLAISDADRDMTALVYSGLMRANKDGVLENDLASNLKISEDGLTYTFTLKNDLFWHDGKTITADDIVFTIEKAQDQTLRSQKRASWDGVLVEKITDREIKFELEHPYAPFLENTTIGILPKHIWQEIDSEQFGFSKYNVEPIGSGPYMVKNVKKDKAGIPKYYDFIPFKKFVSKGPYIEHIRVNFYSNTQSLLDAYENGEIEGVNSVPPKTAEDLRKNGLRVETTPLPRVFGVFFNQNQAEIFTSKIVRKALDIAVDKEKIINDIFYKYATTINSPIPPGAIGYIDEEIDEIASSDRISSAREILTKNGWTFDEESKILTKKTKSETLELAFSISTGDVQELKDVAFMLKEQWEELGAQVEVKIFDKGSLNQDVIRPRKYDSLLFGEIVGRGSDLFAFWHSSQRLDPGLNIALYVNITSDKLLEDARETIEVTDRIKKYIEFQDEIRTDAPATFLYSPDFIYVLPEKIKGVELSGATTPSERFLGIADWYIETDSVWKIFMEK